MILETQRLYVREFSLSDAADFHSLNGDPEIMKYIRQAKTIEESGAFLREVIEGYTSLRGLGRWAIIEKQERQVIGTFSLLPLEHTNEIHVGYALLKKHWGRGYASEIVKAGLLYAYSNLKLTSIVAVTHPENLFSRKILLDNHFKYVGVYKNDASEESLYRHHHLKSL